MKFIFSRLGFGFALASLLLSFNAFNAYAQQTPLDKSLGAVVEEDISNIYRDMGVVQRRAMPKSGRFLFSSYMAMDFSDGPYSLYSVNLNPGIAVSDFFEIYINAVPFFIHRPRSIVEKINSFTGLYDSSQTEVTLAIGATKPKYQYGLEFLWAPLYGKDSLGTRSVVRSDTFLKFGASQIIFEGNVKGYKFHAGIGKTFFLDRWLGLRVAVDGSYQTSITSTGNSSSGIVTDKSYNIFAFLEAGLIFYL